MSRNSGRRVPSMQTSYGSRPYDASRRYPDAPILPASSGRVRSAGARSS